MTSPPIQWYWYPGHIAKAQKALQEQLKRVDVVLEVRDARIPLATHHPQVEQWRQSRGMLPRPVRAVVIGFPNVGKSALINRLLQRRVVESAARPGVTRQLRWIRICDQLELLDAPGVIPAKLDNQSAAFKLAICDDIGDASYDNQRVAAALINLLQYLDATAPDMLPKHLLQSRYELAPTAFTNEDYLHTLAQRRYQGDVERTARHLLTDFRKGLLGAIALELPPS